MRRRGAPGLAAALAAAAALLLPAPARAGSLASALGALDPFAAIQAADCAVAQEGAGLSTSCRATLDDLQAALASDYSYSTDDSDSYGAWTTDYVSSDYGVSVSDVLGFLTGALANAAETGLPDFCTQAPGAPASCAAELDGMVGDWLARLAARRGERPGCSADAGAAAAGAAAAAVSLLTRASCLRAEPAAGGDWCLASMPRALNASGIAAALASMQLGAAAADVAQVLNPAVVCPALAATGCCATSLLAAAQTALSLTCSPQRDSLTATLGFLPMLCAISAHPLPQGCAGFVPPAHAAPSAAECAALRVLADGTDDAIGCALPAGQCPASACDLYCAFDDVVSASTSDASNAAASARVPPPPRLAKPPTPPPPRPAPPPPGGAVRRDRDGDDQDGRGGRDGDGSATSASSGGSGNAGIIAGVIFGVGALGVGTFAAWRSGHLAGLGRHIGDAWAAARGTVAVEEGFELMSDVAGASWS